MVIYLCLYVVSEVNTWKNIFFNFSRKTNTHQKIKAKLTHVFLLETIRKGWLAIFVYFFVARPIKIQYTFLLVSHIFFIVWRLMSATCGQNAMQHYHRLNIFDNLSTHISASGRIYFFFSSKRNESLKVKGKMIDRNYWHGKLGCVLIVKLMVWIKIV